MLSKLLLATNLVMVLVYSIFWSKLPKEIPLFYSSNWGEQQIVDIKYISILPFLTLLVYAINLFLKKKILKNEFFLNKILLYSSFCFIVAYTVIFLKIIFLVTL